MLDAGAAGYVLKPAAARELIEAFRAIHRGEVVLSPSLVKKLVVDYVGRAQMGEGRAIPPNVTAREQEVLTLIAEGYSNRGSRNNGHFPEHSADSLHASDRKTQSTQPHRVGQVRSTPWADPGSSPGREVLLSLRVPHHIKSSRTR